MPVRRVGAVLSELRFAVQLRVIRRRERQALGRLGAAVASTSAAEDAALENLFGQIRNGKIRMDELRHAIAASLRADQTDFVNASRWMRPLVVLRGLCNRAVLRHQIALVGRSLMDQYEVLGAAMMLPQKGRFDLPSQPTSAVEAARDDLRTVLEARSRRLAAYGESALPKWASRLARETKALAGALWMQLRPAILPRSPALVGLAVGWWVAGTYTDSQLRSVLHSLGLGQGGRRVVSGEAYRAMVFWLPIVAAALCAYLADRMQILIQRRYIRPTPDR